MNIKLEKDNIEDILSLTSVQEGMLYHYSMEPNSLEYHVQISIVLAGDINPELLQQAWDYVVRRNELLRTVYRWRKIDRPVQVVLKNKKIYLQHRSSLGDENTNSIITDIRQSDLANRFDLENETFRVYLCRSSTNESTMIISSHHIIFDGWSVAIILKELFNAYRSLYFGMEPIDIPKNKFRNYIEWSLSQNKEKQRIYWDNYLRGFEPNDGLFNRVPPLEMERHSYFLSRDLRANISKFAKENDISEAAFFFCAWAIIALKLNNTKDIIFGTTVSGRSSQIKGIDEMVGLFINTIPLRVSINEIDTLLYTIKAINRVLKERTEYENTPLVEIKEHAHINNSTQFFNSIVVIENYPLDSAENIEDVLTIKEYSAIERTNYNVTIKVTFSDFIQIDLKCNCFDQSDMTTKIGDYFENIISTILTENDLKVVDIDILSDVDRNRILREFNDTNTNYPREKTIYQLFEEQVEKAPQNLALVYQKEKMTYSELNQKSNQLARALQSKGIEKNRFVGIMVERSSDMIVSILGVLKAGGAYLPIDPEYPNERIRFLLEDSEVSILLTQSWLNTTTVFNGAVINLDDHNTCRDDITNPCPTNCARDLAYVIYTSGSTGKPKGVLIEHKSVVNYCLGQIARYGITGSDHVLLFSSISYDASVEQIFSTLLAGASLFIIEKGILLNSHKFLDYMNENAITHLHAVPKFLESLEFEKFSFLKRVVSGGDVCTKIMIQRLNKCSGFEFHNKYGPTETTVSSCIYTVKPENITSGSLIGKPTDNTQLYILDNLLRLMPMGVPGELFISGEGVARGYLNRPNLTSEKFIENPYLPGERMYRTGDMARWLLDGTVEFLGRIDNQVKIRGFRIELGEIENALLEIETVREAVALSREDEQGDKYLCAYIVSEKEIPASELRRKLSESLPDYMVPSYYVNLASLPLNPNGKVDRKALSIPHRDCERKFETPRNRVEETITEIWSEVLGVDKVGIHNNFFDLGGHSLKGTYIISRIYKELNVELSLKELFKSPTVAGISGFIENKVKSEHVSIKKAEEKEVYEVSSAQKRIYLMQQMDSTETGYNITAAILVEGILCKDKVEEVFKNLINRHDVLKTSFEIIDDKIVQRINRNFRFAMDYREKTDECIDSIIEDFVKPFDLNIPPLLRVGLIKLAEENHLLLFDIHHIIADGVSISILTREFTELYEDKELKNQYIRYIDFSEWQNAHRRTDKILNQKKYWVEKFSDELPVLNLPLDYSRPAVRDHRGDYIEFKVAKTLKEKVISLAKMTGTTIYIVLLSIMNILMSKHSDQEDIIIGTPIAGRQHADLENVLGMFVNTLAIRNYPKSDKTYEKFLNEVGANTLKAYENQEYQFEDLVDHLNLHRDASRNPIFDVMFTLQTDDLDKFEFSGVKSTRFEPKKKKVKFDLEFTVAEEGDELLFSIGYCVRLFRRDSIELLAGHLCNIIKAVTEDSGVLIGEIDVLSDDEKNTILHEYNDTYSKYPRDKTIHQAFEEQVMKNPDGVALVFRGDSMTYSELNNKANQLAKRLRKQGVGRENIVGILIDRSFEMIIGILGILKAGGTYLPMDPEYPKERLAFLLSDSEPCILLTQSWLRRNVDFIGEVLELDNTAVFVGDDTNLEPLCNAHDLAYIIYTSGSTGSPKGVMIEHKSLINYCLGQIKRLRINENDRSVQTSPITFDMSVEQIFTTLLGGASLFLIEKEVLLESADFSRFLYENAITYLHAVPSLLENLDADKLEHMRIIVSGGELCTPNLVKRLIGKGDCEFQNSYGPTEATIISTMHLVKLEETISSIPIGKPIDNAKLYILNKELKLVPRGVAGEIFIGGEGLARGYLGKPELTSERFIENPFCPGERIYRTGDLARWLPDGNAEFLGRMDRQVKIRGARIELGEIESSLLEMSEVKEVIVDVRGEENNNKFLCAYVVIEQSVSTEEFRTRLSKKLPAYMIPACFIQLDALPLNRNGKVDRNLLPSPESGSSLIYEAPRNVTEEIIAKIWSDILEINEVGINNNFFELGGHSLKGTLISSRIRKELNVELPLKELFKTPTVAGISRYLNNARPTMHISIDSLDEKEYYATSFTQKRMWILNLLQPESPAYNISSHITLYEAVDHSVIINVLRKLIKRHEALRTHFEERDGVLVQLIEKDVEFSVDFADISILNHGDKQKERNCIRNKLAMTEFNLRTGCLLVAKLVKIEDNEYDLVFCTHHIITDGWSLEILKREFFALYYAFKQGTSCELANLRIQYKEFSAWQNNLIVNEGFSKAARRFWSKQIGGKISELRLPRDYQVCNTNRGSNYRTIIDGIDKDRLKTLAQLEKTSLFIVLLATIKSFLWDLTGQRDILIGIASFGRDHIDLQNIIGHFINTVILRSEVNRDDCFSDLLMKISSNTLEALEYQYFPLELILEEERIQYPKVSAFFNMLNFEETSNINTDDLSSYHIEQVQDVKFDLEWYITEYLNGIEIKCTYNSGLFEPSTIEFIMNEYIKFIGKVSENPNKLIYEYFLSDKKSIF